MNLKEYLIYFNMQEYIKEFEALEKQIEQMKCCEWISVKDRQLPIDKEVVVLSKTIFGNYLTGLATMDKHRGLSGYNFNDIKFWMPLPPPPEADKE